MVAIPLGIHAPSLSPLDSSPRDWSHRWDKQEPPRKGEPAFVVMLIGVRRKARWRPRTLDAKPPVVHLLGACCMDWTRSKDAATADCHEFNRRQVGNRRGVTLWALVGFGLTGFSETAQIVEGGAV